MATSSRHTNISSAVWTPTGGGGATTFKGVQSANFDPRGELLTHSGDADVFPTTKVLIFQDPDVSLTCRDLTAVNALSLGARGSLAISHIDAKNGMTTGQGGYTATLANAILANKTTSAQHRQWGEAQLRFEAESTDGTTNPLTFAAA